MTSYHFCKYYYAKADRYGYWTCKCTNPRRYMLTTSFIAIILRKIFGQNTSCDAVAQYEKECPLYRSK